MPPATHVNGPSAYRQSRIRRPWRWLPPVVLLASLLLGAALHEWHHLTDPGCGTRADSAGCWCTNLHASANTVPVTPAPEPIPAPVDWAAVPGTTFACPEVFASGPPRAPPLG